MDADSNILTIIHSYLKSKGFVKLEGHEQTNIDRNEYFMIANMIRINTDLLKLNLGLLNSKIEDSREKD